MVDDSFYVVIALISAGFVTVPISIGLVRYRGFRKHHKAILLLMLFALAIDIISYAFWELHLKTAIVFRIYTIVEFALLSYYFITVMNRRNLELPMKIVFGAFGVVTILDASLQGVMSIDNYSIAIESIIFILYSVFSMFLIIKEASYQDILQASRFWIIIAVLIYFSGSLLVFVFSNYLLRESPGVFKHLWGINSILNVIFYSLIAVAFWKTRPTTS